MEPDSSQPCRGYGGPIRQNLSLKRKRKEVELRREERDTRHEIIQKTSYFNFIKMHLPVHYRDHVKWLGAIGAYSTEMGKSARREQLKDAYQHSNRKNYTDQIIAYYTRISALRM